MAEIHAGTDHVVTKGYKDQNSWTNTPQRSGLRNAAIYYLSRKDASLTTRNFAMLGALIEPVNLLPLYKMLQGKKPQSSFEVFLHSTLHETHKFYTRAGMLSNNGEPTNNEMHNFFRKDKSTLAPGSMALALANRHEEYFRNFLPSLYCLSDQNNCPSCLLKGCHQMCKNTLPRVLDFTTEPWERGTLIPKETCIKCRVKMAIYVSPLVLPLIAVASYATITNIQTTPPTQAEKTFRILGPESHSA